MQLQYLPLLINPLKKMQMVKVVNLVYYCHQDYRLPQQVIDKQRPAFGFADFINPLLDIEFIKHLDHTGVKKINGLRYAFFKSRNRFWYIPFTTHRYIKKQLPDIVMIEGLVFPLQLIMLKLLLGGRSKFIVRHHGEKPFRGIKGFFQRMADRYTDAYLFTSYSNAAEWIPACIKDPGKCREVLEASTHFSRKDITASRLATGVTGTHSFLWVGRLIAGKDPFTVLAAFEQYALLQPAATLHMIYQDEELLPAVKEIIMQSKTLAATVKLVGRIDNDELPGWYSAANFFISGSLGEAAGYAILEAMACGCIPVVTAIPSFTKITGDGQYGFLFPPGDAIALKDLLMKLDTIAINAARLRIETYFREHLGFKNIADDLFDICMELKPNAI